MVDVVSRSEWGANYYGTPQLPRGYYTVGMAEKDEFFVHYHGGPPAHDRGVAMCREVEKIHHDNGWSGVGYGFLVGQDGRAFEGRGWDGVAVACPDHNRRGIHVYVAIGGDQVATIEALRTVVALRDEHRRRRAAIGRPAPAEFVHGDKFPTSCAGPFLTPWVHAGMPLPEEDDIMAALSLDEAVQKIAHAVVYTIQIPLIGRTDTASVATLLRVTYDRVTKQAARLNEVEAKVDGAIEAVKATSTDPDRIAAIVDKAVRDRLAKLAVVDREDETAPAPEVQP